MDGNWATEIVDLRPDKFSCMSYNAVVTNDHKLSGLKQHRLSYCPSDQKSTISLIKLKKLPAWLHSFQNLQRIINCLAFSSFCYLSIFLGLQPPSSVFKVQHSNFCFHCHLSFSDADPSCCCCSVALSCLTLCNPMDCSMPDSPVLHCLPEFAQILAH